MASDQPFTNYAELEKHALKLRLRSETAALRFGNHCHALADKEVRAVLMKDAMNDAIHGFKPLHAAAEVVTRGGIGSQLAMGLLTRKGGVKRRLLSSAAALVLPNLLAKVPWSDLLHKLSTALHTKDEPVPENGVHSTPDERA